MRPPPPGRLFGLVYHPLIADVARPPVLHVVVDTEAGFDWSLPFARDLTDVSAMDDVERGQEILERHGVRPIYAIDYPVASQKRAIAPLRRILARGACVLGAHLHPWTNPPFTEAVCAQHSFPGNLPPELEEAKFIELVAVIERNFGVRPWIYKAGRYGFGPQTAGMLARHGVRVDLSVLPGADLRRLGGPDFSSLHAIPYKIGGTDILALPMTRAVLGLAPSVALSRLARLPLLEALRVPALLAQLRLNETVTLTPEGMTAAEQIRLIDALLALGRRVFVLHYHSPSLTPGHTPYVRDAADLRSLLTNLDAVCRHFFDVRGGQPGNPEALPLK